MPRPQRYLPPSSPVRHATRTPRDAARAVAIVAAALAVASGVARAHDCDVRAHMVPVPGEAGAFRVTAPHRTSIVRLPHSRPTTATALFVIQALDHTFDSDGSSATVHDTLIVPLGATVRWQLVTGIHTLTNGTGSSDPQAGTKFDLLLTPSADHFDSTFQAPTTLNFFCSFHEPDMAGTLIVTGSTGVPETPASGELRFSSPPTPNPATDRVRFALAVPRATRVRVDVFDVAGRRVATLLDQELTAGEHTMSWDGRIDGVRAPAGRYRVRWMAQDRAQSLGFSLTR